MFINNAADRTLLPSERLALERAQRLLEDAFGRSMFSATVTAMKEDARVMRGVVFQFDLKEVPRDDF